MVMRRIVQSAIGGRTLGGVEIIMSIWSLIRAMMLARGVS
jgi:hypothetical protein